MVVAVPFANVPLAPLPGAVNVTITPLAGLLLVSVTVATSGAPKAVLIVALCPDPLVTFTFAGAADVLVSEKFAEVAPAALATTLYGPPTVAFAVKVEDVATPLPFVVAVVEVVPFANVPLAPLLGAVNVTTTPLTGLLLASIAVATSGAPKAVLIGALCPDPLVTLTFAAAPAVFVNAKLAEVAPVALATTLYGPPAAPFAVNVEDVATPLAFVVAVVEVVPFANVPLAPLPGAVNVTTTPLTGLLNESFTVACSAAPNAVFTVELCGVPPVAVTLAGAPATPPAGFTAANSAPQLSELASVAPADTNPAAAWS